MKLTYRGQSYESNSSSVLQPAPKTVKLIYRGETFEYTPSQIAPYRNITQTAGYVRSQKTKLIYRGQVVDRAPAPPQPYRRPRAMNWRYEWIANPVLA